MGGFLEKGKSMGTIDAKTFKAKSSPLQIAQTLLTGSKPDPAAIRVELIDSDTATVHAQGITITSSSPILDMCRALLEAGNDPDRPLIAYRNGAPALTLNSIAAGAQWTVNGKCTGFRRVNGVATGSPARKNGSAGVGHPPGDQRTSDALSTSSVRRRR
jgi:hypothetical protein